MLGPHHLEIAHSPAGEREEDRTRAHLPLSNIVDALGSDNIFGLNEMVELFRSTNGDLYVRTQNGIARLTR